MQAAPELMRTTGASLCLDCGKCTSSCPLATLGNFSARLIVQEGCGPAAGNGRLVQQCLTCGACETRCPEGVRITDFVRGLRALTPVDERAPCPHGAIFQNIARAMAGPTPPERSSAWLGDDLRVREEGEVALFVGCLPFFDRYFAEDLGVRTMDAAVGAVRALNALGIEPVVASDERCCGHDLLWDGETEVFDTLARANAETFAARGVKHVLTLCAECCRTWRLDYPAVVSDYSPRIQHLAEFFSDRLDTGEVRFEQNSEETLTYQDPCRLGRDLGVTDAPRRVLDAMPGTKIVEMELAGRDAVCCGTSGFIRCNADSRSLQASRLESARATGAGGLVTACPKCLIHFSCAQAEDKRRGIDGPSITVRDLTALAAERLMGPGQVEESTPVTDGRNIGVVAS